MMISTTESLMTSGFQVIFGYTESDEISLLFALNEKQFGRKLRKYAQCNGAPTDRCSKYHRAELHRESTNREPVVRQVTGTRRWLAGRRRGLTALTEILDQLALTFQTAVGPAPAGFPAAGVRKVANIC
jgi:hypothetical protein